MASPGGPSLEHTDPDRILTPARGVRSVTKAARCRDPPCRTCTIRDQDHGYLCACSAWPRVGVSSTNEPVRRSERVDRTSRPAKASCIRIGCSRTRGRFTAPHNMCGVWPAVHAWVSLFVCLFVESFTAPRPVVLCRTSRSGGVRFPVSGRPEPLPHGMDGAREPLSWAQFG